MYQLMRISDYHVIGYFSTEERARYFQQISKYPTIISFTGRVKNDNKS